MSLSLNTVATRTEPARKAKIGFSFEQDSFAFPNELYWEYRFEPETGKTVTVKRDPPPSYAHHCFVLVRSARQFLFHAQFAPEQTRLQNYQSLVAQVVRRAPWRASNESERVIIPGYANLREFSHAREHELKSSCGGAWQSYFLRSHWRMVFPVSRRHQEGTAQGLIQAIRSGRPPIVHVFRFPQLTINHGLLVFGFAESASRTEFFLYDPNIPERATAMEYSHQTREFFLPANHYWAGGMVNVLQVYRNRFF